MRFPRKGLLTLVEAPDRSIDDCIVWRLLKMVLGLVCLSATLWCSRGVLRSTVLMLRTSIELLASWPYTPAQKGSPSSAKILIVQLTNDPIVDLLPSEFAVTFPWTLIRLNCCCQNFECLQQFPAACTPFLCLSECLLKQGL